MFYFAYGNEVIVFTFMVKMDISMQSRRCFFDLKVLTSITCQFSDKGDDDAMQLLTTKSWVFVSRQISAAVERLTDHSAGKL